MRFESILVGWFALAPLLSVACSKDKSAGLNAGQTAEANASAAVEVAPTNVHARLGGKLVALGSYLTELLVHADGEAKALLMESDGKLTSTPGDAALSLQMAEVGGTEANIKLAWDPARASFVGHARAGAKLMAGPAKVDLAFKGKTMNATLALMPVVTGPRFGGQLLAVGDLGAEVGLHHGGLVEAHLWNAKLEPVTGAAGAKVEALMAVGGRAAETVALTWNEPHAQFEGQANFQGALAPADVELRVNLGGVLNAGALAHLAVAGEARHGGTLLTAGDYSAELLLGERGLVQAFVMDVSGKAEATGNLGVNLILPNQPALTLKWEPPCACYQAKLTGGLDLSTTPVELSLLSGGRLHIGGVAALKASVDAALAARARQEAEPAAGVRGNGNASLKIEPPSIHVTPPKLNANASASLGAQSGAKASAKAAVKAPSVSIKPPSVSAKAGAKAGVKLGF